jgi:hypothetical protein
MKYCAIILFFFGLLSCHSEHLINKDNITKIVFFNEEKQVVISDKDSISTIVKKINGANYEPAIFPTEYEIDVYYNDSIVAILCYSDLININGKPYKLSKPLKAYFE